MSTLTLSPHLLETPFPGIAEINARADKLRRSGHDLINLGQAVPWYPPPGDLVERLKTELGNPAVHRYSLDPGLPELREALSDTLRARLAHTALSADGLLITAGANSAYLITLMGIMRPGDRMGLLTPWYFNHDMAARLLGHETVAIPLSSDHAFALDAENILDAVDRYNLQALTIVNPNNPTGATYDPEQLTELALQLQRRGVWLIADETYAFFPGPGCRPFSLGSLADRLERLIVIGSFSKTFAMTGWRIGYLAASPTLIQELLKIQDTMLICASHPGQRLALSCLRDGWNWLAERVHRLEQRRLAFVSDWPSDSPWRLVSSGPFFAWLEGPADGRATVLRLLESAGVILIPGDIFGPGLDCTIRVSLGCVDDAAFAEGKKRLFRGLQDSISREP